MNGFVQFCFLSEDEEIVGFFVACLLLQRCPEGRFVPGHMPLGK